MMFTSIQNDISPSPKESLKCFHSSSWKSF